jgi:hypothetical protein
MKIDNIDNTLEEIQELGDQMRQINEAVAQVGRPQPAEGGAREGRACGARHPAGRAAARAPPCAAGPWGRGAVGPSLLLLTPPPSPPPLAARWHVC